MLKVLDFLFDDKLKAEIEETKENHDKLMLKLNVIRKVFMFKSKDDMIRLIDSLMITCQGSNGIDETKICQELITAVQNDQKSMGDIKRTNKKEGIEIQLRDQEEAEFWKSQGEVLNDVQKSNWKQLN